MLILASRWPLWGAVAAFEATLFSACVYKISNKMDLFCHLSPGNAFLFVPLWADVLMERTVLFAQASYRLDHGGGTSKGPYSAGNGGWPWKPGRSPHDLGPSKRCDLGAHCGAGLQEHVPKVYKLQDTYGALLHGQFVISPNTVFPDSLSPLSGIYLTETWFLCLGKRCQALGRRLFYGSLVLGSGGGAELQCLALLPLALPQK